MRPTTRTINTCIDAWAKSGEIGADDRILEWMERMKESDHLFGRNFVFRPDKWTYNSYLQALARSGKPNIGTRAEQVIAEMEELHRNGVHGVKPDVVTFTNVVHCIARSGQDDAVDRALATLIRLEDLHEQGHGDLRPNLFTYNW